MRPWELEPWIIAGTRDSSRAGRQAEEQNAGNIEAVKRTELLFHAKRQVTKTRGCTRSCRKVIEVVWNSEPELRLFQKAVSGT